MSCFPLGSKEKLSHMFYILTSAVSNTKEVEFWHPSVQVPDTGWDDQQCLKLLFHIHLWFSPLCFQQCFLPSTCIFLYPSVLHAISAFQILLIFPQCVLYIYTHTHSRDIKSSFIQRAHNLFGNYSYVSWFLVVICENVCAIGLIKKHIARGFVPFKKCFNIHIFHILLFFFYCGVLILHNFHLKASW